MHLSSLIEMIESGFGDRVLVGGRNEPALSGVDLADLVRRGWQAVADAPAVVYAGENHPLLPLALLSAACAGVPFVPVNYRLENAQLNALVARYPGALVLADPATTERLRTGSTDFEHWLEQVRAVAPRPLHPCLDDNQVAVALFTSGTTAEPKTALLRHRHLMAYLLGAVEFASAGPDEAVLIAVPPYHVAGVANMLSNLFAGRRLVYLTAFGARQWLETVRTEHITHAMVVPTMLRRIVDELAGAPADVPSLRSLSYGGAKVSEKVIVDALASFPDTGFVNAYGLTETASTIAVLGPEDHRSAVTSADPVQRRRISSAGRLLPTVDIEVRGDDGSVLDADQIGSIFVRGDQISGEYATGSVLDADGWFCTRDLGFVDSEGYLFIEGRADDTIIRGAENIAPAEIESVLTDHPDVHDACVVGLPDDEWGQRIVAAVVRRPGGTVSADELRELARHVLRGSKTPELIVFRDHLPHTDSGKLLRREVQRDLQGETRSSAISVDTP